MLGKEQMQTITVDGDAQETWLSKVRRFHTEVKLLVVDTAGQQYTLIEIKKETAKWHYIESCASKFILTSKSTRKTIWPCHYGPTLALHIRIDERGQLEVWSDSVPVAKYFESHATPEEWNYGFFHVSASSVINLAALLLYGRTATLKSLDLSGAENIFDLQPLENFTELVLLDISFCCEIIDIKSLAILNKLTSLSMYGCSNISDIRPLARLLDLTSLILSHCSEIININPLEKITQLTLLNISGCTEIRDISSLKNLKKLTALNLSGCREIHDISQLEKLTELTHLNLSSCVAIRDLRPLEKLTQLTSLDLSYCVAVRDLKPLEKLNQLTSLDISDQWETDDLSPLANLNRLTSLKLSGCSELHDISLLKNLTQLTSLDISRCDKLCTIDQLDSLRRLTSLNLSSCSRLCLVATIAALPSLIKLKLDSCPNIRDANRLCDSVALCNFEYDETATRDIVLLACAARRDDADLADRTATAAASFELSKTPDLHALHLVSAIEALSLRAEDHADVFCAVAAAFRARGEVPLKTWETLLTAIVRAPDPGLRPAFEMALEDLPLSEIERILGPALIALADAPASARGWALDLAQRALVPVAASASHAREVAPAAAVFFHAQGRTADVDAWLERGSVAQVPAWRDRVLVALLSRALRMDEVLEARRLLGLVQTPERRDEARGMLVQHLAEKAEFRDAAAELDAIVDRARRASVAAQALERTVAFASESHAGLSLLLALDGDPDTLADVLTAMVQQTPDSELVRQLAVVFAPTAGVDLGEAVDALLAMSRSPNGPDPSNWQGCAVEYALTVNSPAECSYTALQHCWRKKDWWTTKTQPN